MLKKAHGFGKALNFRKLIKAFDYKKLLLMLSILKKLSIVKSS